MNGEAEGVVVSMGYDDPSEVQSPNGAKTGAVGARVLDVDRQLAWLNDVWSSLPEDARAAVINIAREAMPFAEYTEQGADARGAGPF